MKFLYVLTLPAEIRNLRFLLDFKIRNLKNTDYGILFALSLVFDVVYSYNVHEECVSHIQRNLTGNFKRTSKKKYSSFICDSHVNVFKNMQKQKKKVGVTVNSTLLLLCATFTIHLDFCRSNLDSSS